MSQHTISLVKDMETDKGKGKMTDIDDIVEELGGYEGLEDVHIDISMLEDDQCDNGVIPVSAAATELFSSSSNNPSRNSQRRASPFVLKIYEMLADIQFKSLISWSNNGTSFIINDNHKFAVQVLPRFFRHNNLSSFICQLNSYGFRKINWDKFEFQHQWFQRGKGVWLKNIKRKPSKSQMNEQPRQGIDVTAALTMEKEIEEIRAEQVAMRDEIMMLQLQLDLLEKDMEDINQEGSDLSSKKAKICMLLFKSLIESTRRIGSTQVAQVQGGDDVGNRGNGYRGDKRRMQVEGELEGDNERSKRIACASDLKSDSYFGKMLMDEMNLNNLAQEQPDNFLESEELAGSSTFWTDYVEKMDHKAISSGVPPAFSQSQETPP